MLCFPEIYLNWLHALFFFSQFNAHFIHLYNLTSTGESHKRQIDELKGQQIMAEGRIKSLIRENASRTAGQQSAEEKRDRLSTEAEVLKTQLWKANERFKVAEEKSLGLQKKTQELESASDEAQA